MAPKIRIAFVPEHYSLPLHLSTLSSQSQEYTLHPFPSGTGSMITALRAGEIDLAIGLTEGWVSGLLSQPATGPSSGPPPGSEKEGKKVRGGYAIIGEWVLNPLRWAIVTGRERGEINGVPDLRSHRRVGVSRFGSGSHIMASVLAHQEGWSSTSTSSSPSSPSSPSRQALEFIPLGPLPNLIEGVSSKSKSTSTSTGEVTETDDPDPVADFFMWEEFTTKPYFCPSSSTPSAPLKKIGEIYTPWPSWHIVASSLTFPDPDSDPRLATILEALDGGIEMFNGDHEAAIKILVEGDGFCRYSEGDAREWLKSVRFTGRTRGVNRGVMEGVVKVLKSAGVVGQEKEIREGDGVIGISR